MIIHTTVTPIAYSSLKNNAGKNNEPLKNTNVPSIFRANLLNKPKILTLWKKSK
tara:strand:- start:101855 stop:102016 length:162 start_codon:yes stop_codon:yes gene_type:complete